MNVTELLVMLDRELNTENNLIVMKRSIEILTKLSDFNELQSNSEM